MGLEKGVLEVPDSEDELTTSSPAEVLYPAQYPQDFEHAAARPSLPDFRGSQLRASSGSAGSPTLDKERNMDDIPTCGSLRSVNTFERDHAASYSHSPAHSLQLDEHYSLNTRFEKQSRESKSAANPFSSSEEYFQGEKLGLRSNHESTALREDTKPKASNTLEQLAEAEPGFIDTRKALVAGALGRSLPNGQSIGTTETITETHGAVQSDSSRQHDMDQYDSLDATEGITKQSRQPSEVIATQDDKAYFAGKPTTHSHAEWNGNARSTESISSQLSSADFSSQLEDLVTLKKAGPKPLSDSKGFELRLYPESRDERTRNIVNRNDEETLDDYRDISTSNPLVSTGKVTFRELSETDISQPLQPPNMLDMEQQAGSKAQTPAESEHSEDTSNTKIAKLQTTLQPVVPVPFTEPSLHTNSGSQMSVEGIVRPNLPVSLSKPSTEPKPSSPKKNSQEINLAELRAQRSALLASLAALSNVQDRMDDTVWQSANAEPTDADAMTAANRIVKDHIKLLHEYNEIKDVGQGLMGLIADQRGVRIVEVQDEFGIGSKD